MKTQLWAIALILIADFIGALGPIFMKKGSKTVSLRNPKTLYLNKYVIISLIIFGVSTILFIPALRGGDLSVLYPLTSISQIMVCVYSIIFLKEKMTKEKWMGVSLVIIGISLIGIGA